MRSELRFLPLFALAALNDAVDVLGLVAQPYETIFDVILATAISLAVGLDVVSFLIAVADLIPGLDAMPIWTLYVLYKFLEYKERAAEAEKGGVRPRRVRVPVE